MARILLVEDDDSVRTMLRKTPMHFGHTVTLASEGEEGPKPFKAAGAAW